MFFAINLNASSLHLRFIFKAAYTFSRRIQWFQKIHQIAAKLKTNFFLTKLKMWWRTDAQSFLFETSLKLENTRMSHWYLLYASLDFRVIQRIFWTLCIVRDYRETNRKCFFSGNIDKYWCILLLLSSHRVLRETFSYCQWYPRIPIFTFCNCFKGSYRYPWM